MGKLSRIKGHNFEREIARKFKLIFPEAKRGLQYQNNNCADVVIPYFFVECKRQKKCNIKQALKQAKENCPVAKIPLAITQDDREEIIVSIPFEQFLYIAKLISQFSNI